MNFDAVKTSLQNLFNELTTLENLVADAEKVLASVPGEEAPAETPAVNAEAVPEAETPGGEAPAEAPAQEPKVEPTNNESL